MLLFLVRKCFFLLLFLQSKMLFFCSVEDVKMIMPHSSSSANSPLAQPVVWVTGSSKDFTFLQSLLVGHKHELLQPLQMKSHWYHPLCSAGSTSVDLLKTYAPTVNIDNYQ